MAKGYLAGAVWGLVTSAVGAGALSLAVGLPPTTDMISDSAGVPEPEAVTQAAMPDDPATEALPDADTGDAPRVAEDPVPDPAAQLPDSPPVRFEENTDAAPDSAPPPPEPARRPGAETNVAEPQIAPLDAPEDAPETTLSDLATAPGTTPDAAFDSDAPPMPETSEAGGGVAVTTEAPVLPSVQAALPDAPGAEREPSVATEPAQPPQPAVPSESSGLVSDPDPATETQTDARVAAETDPESVTPQPDTEPAPTTAVRILPAPEAQAQASDRPAIGTPGTSLADRAPAVAEGRLPTVGAAVPQETDPQATPEVGPTPPLEAFAVPVDVADGLPRIAIVLIDEGTGPLGPDAFETFPFPVTFALDPTQPGAGPRMQGYRAQGFEVLALVGMPEGAQPSDVEVTLQGSFSAVSEAVGVLETPGLGLQGSRAVSDQVASALSATGHGLVLQDNGLNTAASLAARDGVPVATVFKDFDGDGQDPRAIRRFLDGAAFRARRDGTAVVMGRLSADTLSAVLLWGLQDRSGQLALVPVSNVLRSAAN